MERLDKFLCDCGAGTRSQVKIILKNGRATVDGKPERDGSRKIDPDTQSVCLDGELLNRRGRVVVMLNKPAGFVTATEDKNEKTVMELLPAEYGHLELKPVGRLDKATEGLLLFTNDGDLLHRLISPKKEVPKLYYAKHEGMATDADVKAFADGITLGDGTKCLPAILQPLGPGESLVTVCEGKYHQVKRMFASVGCRVVALRRVRIGALALDDALSPGESREMSYEEAQLVFDEYDA